MAAKISSDMVKPFNGEGDVLAWLEKVQLVAELSGVTELAKFIPLFLEGSALSVYLELTKDEKLVPGTIIARLKEVYSDSVFVAFRKVMSMRWMGEPIDAFVTEIRRLAGLAGFVGEIENVVRLTFINSFPDSISIELQQIDGIATMDMSKIITKARVLTTSGGGVAAGAVRQDSMVASRGLHGGRGKVRGGSFREKVLYLRWASYGEGLS